jgi:geranylgeranyl pyrophosphate synthase
LAACAEVGWSCALVLDDIRDRSVEREGAPSAHRQYGALRCIVSVLATLALIARELAWRGEASRQVRLARLGLGVTLVLRAGAAAFGRAPRSLAAYRVSSRRVNSSIHWALLGPHRGGPKTAPHEALQRYADHSAVAGKMRNDLLDYWGGSSERDSVLEDFHRGMLSFPTLVLLDSPLAMADRNRLAAHFGAGRTLAPPELFELFRTYAIEERCLALLDDEIAACDAAVESLASSPRSEHLCTLLKAWNRHMLDGCRARLHAHS